MRVRVLGAAAGGGFPQWNCDCPVCSTARIEPIRARPRTQSCTAVQGISGGWLLINASPDVAAQLEGLRNGGCADIVAVVLTDGELDHTLGLLRLREGDRALTVLATPSVRHSLTNEFPIDAVLSHWAGLSWHELPVDGPAVELDGLAITAFITGDSGPRFARAHEGGQAVVGLSVTDGSSTLACAPCVAVIDEAVAAHLRRADCVLFDGTCWTDEELLGVRKRGRTATAMGHLPLDGPSGSLHALQQLEVRRLVLTHINNTNPVLVEDSPERSELRTMGVEVAHDGLELEL